MKFLIAIIFITSFAPYINGQNTEEELETFWWQNTGSIEVPKGFTKDYYNYREGYIFTLKYKDGSFIKLHRGGMIVLPFFQNGEEFEVEQIEDFDDRIFRCGKKKNKKLYWCEVNFKRRKGLIFPPNLSFSNVKKKNLELFKDALKSFKCELCEASKNESESKTSKSEQQNKTN